MISPRDLCQLEFYSSDIDASLKFFERVFGWKALPITLQDYWVLEVPEECPFGISIRITTEKSNPNGGVTTAYFRCQESLASLIQKTLANEGKVIEGPRFVPAYGQVLRILAPGGITLGIFHPGDNSALNQID